MWYVVIGVLVVALIGALVWVFAFSGDDSSDDPTAKPTSSETVKEPTPEPSGEPSSDPSEGASEDESPGEGSAGDFPAKVGDWTFRAAPAPAFEHTDGRTVTLEALPSTEDDYLKELQVVKDSPTTTVLEEFDGGYCFASKVMFGGELKPYSYCQVIPGTHPGKYWQMTADQPDRTSVAEMKKLGEAVVAHPDYDDEAGGEDDLFPRTAGDWVLEPGQPLPDYRDSKSGRVINIQRAHREKADYERELEQIRDGSRTTSFEEFDGGYCYTSERDTGGSMLRTTACQVLPPAGQGESYLLLGQPESTTLEDMLVVARAIANG